MNCFLKWAKLPFKQRETCLCCTGADIINDLNRQAGTTISLKDRKAAPALGSRFLRSYVPLRCSVNSELASESSGRTALSAAQSGAVIPVTG